MAYLRLKDYYNLIQDVNLQQIINSDDSIRVDVENAALAEVKSYIVQKYDVADEFRDTVQFTFTDTYKAKQLVYLDAAAYSAALTYALNVMVLQGGNVYYCKTAIIAPEAFNLIKWTLLGPQYKLFNIPTPYAEFNLYNNYSVNDFSYWVNKVYKCLSPSVIPSHQGDLQSFNTFDIPPNNYFPNNALYGSKQWGTGQSYSFTGLWPSAVYGDFATWLVGSTYTAGDIKSYNSIIWRAQAGSTGVTPGTDITKWLPVSWLAGDNRNPQIIQRLIDITLYHLHSRIAPRNIPDLRVKRYDDAIKWLKDCAKGFVTLDAPLIQPKSGSTIRMGSEVKRKNSY